MPCSAKYFIPCFWKHKRACPIYADTSVDIHGYFYMWQIHKEHCCHNTYKTREAQEKRFRLERQGLERFPPKFPVLPPVHGGRCAAPSLPSQPTLPAPAVPRKAPGAKPCVKEAADLSCALVRCSQPRPATPRATPTNTPQLSVCLSGLERNGFHNFSSRLCFGGGGRAAIHLKS